jgi:hypothetical protein
MRSFVLTVVGLLVFGTAMARADESNPNMSGVWKLDPARSELDQTNKDLALVIEEKGQNIHIKGRFRLFSGERAGQNPGRACRDLSVRPFRALIQL